ncbi:MAG: hypothetical protein KGJ88_10225 [Verrucomicrobiota bacterium]|nr:hypothetical protein [Verrucomicrobiota bacterium]
MAQYSPAQLLINGGFESGNFAGWTLFNTVGSETCYGLEEGGTVVTQVVSFDTAGAGAPSNSAEFEVGETSGIIGGGGLGQGAGIYQDVTLEAGEVNISLAIGATSSGENYDAGTFELLLDGNVLACNELGMISAGQTIRSTLGYRGDVTAGMHQFAIDMRRGYGTDSSTPFQYLANIQMSETPVPEPSVFWILAFGVVGWRPVFFRGWSKKEADFRDF